jgi:hypothetical protein
LPPKKNAVASINVFQFHFFCSICCRESIIKYRYIRKQCQQSHSLFVFTSIEVWCEVMSFASHSG